MNTLEEVRKYLNGIPNINCGGCGIVAYAMYLWLKDRNWIDHDTFKFVLVYRSDIRYIYENNCEALTTRNGQARAPAHIYIFHNDKYIDSDTISDKITDYPLVQYVNEPWFIKNCIDNRWSWNSHFDRDYYIPKIEQKLNIKLTLEE